MTTTTDPTDPALGHGVDAEPVPQQEKYLVLSDEERAKGFVRPVRVSYIHRGPSGPHYPLRDLTDEQKERFPDYAKWEAYPDSELPRTGRFWTQSQLDKVGKGCGTVTSMAQPIAETYARDPHFYGSTYCTGCQRHLPVDEFVWADDWSRVGS